MEGFPEGSKKFLKKPEAFTSMPSLDEPAMTKIKSDSCLLKQVRLKTLEKKLQKEKLAKRKRLQCSQGFQKVFYRFVTLRN